MSFETYMDAHYPGWRDAARDVERQPSIGELRAVHAAGVAEEQARALAILDSNTEWGPLSHREIQSALRAAIATTEPRVLERDHRGDVVAARLPDSQIVTFDPPVPEAPAQPSGTSVLVELVMADDAYLQAAKGSPAIKAGRRLDAAWVAARSLVLPAQPSGEGSQRRYTVVPLTDDHDRPAFVVQTPHGKLRQTREGITYYQQKFAAQAAADALNSDLAQSSGEAATDG